MIKHYLKVAFRNMWKYKTQSLIGVFGLAFGLACFVPALYWLRYETSYDSFYPDAEQIYRIYAVEKQLGKMNDLVPVNLGKKLHEQFPAIKASTVIMSETNNCSTEGTPHIQLRTLNTFNSFFDVFPQEFLCGDTRQPLQVRNNIVITETVAVRLFGEVEKAIGQQIQSTFYFFTPPYTVSAVVKDPPSNTNLPFDALIHHDLLSSIAEIPEDLQWPQFISQTYVRLHPLTVVNDFDKQIHDFTSQVEAIANFEVRLLPVSDVRHRLDTNAPFTPDFMKLFVAAGILLIASALFNFLNLYLDLFRQRIHEFRQRAVHGAKGRQLIVQMLFELTCPTLLSLALALGLVMLSVPYFSALLNIMIEPLHLVYLFTVCGSFVIMMMLLSGILPLWCLIRAAVHDLSKQKSTRRSVLQRLTTSVQLSVSIIFIIAAWVVMLQIRFVSHKDLGFNRTGIIQLSGLTPFIQRNIRTALEHELEAIPQIINISTSNFEPRYNANLVEMVSEVEWPGKAPFVKPAFNIIPTDSRFSETFMLEMLMGKWWDEGETLKIVLNEEAVREMGLNEPIGAIISITDYNTIGEPVENYEVVGVVNDFHTLSLRSRIHPTIFRPSWSNAQLVSDNILYIHVVPGQEQEVTRRINTILPDIDASFADVRLTPIGELYDGFNRSEQVGLKLFACLAIVCLLISLFGIYAVATASTQRRCKEIAIRKVFGAEVRDIVSLFFREYTLQVIIAGAIALPIAYYAMHQWLQGYAYRTNISWWLLTGVIVAVAAVVMLTVLGQIWKAANQNPAEVVKNE